MSTQRTVTLNNGAELPQVGFGVWRISEEETEAAVTAALEAGYRAIDTAASYRNERAVGRAIRASGLPREELFITTKLDVDAHGRDAAPRAFEQSRSNLGLDYVDMYLIHWPVPKLGLYAETWQVMEGLVAAGVAKGIGVSNFKSHHLDRLAEVSGVVPALNQIELNPYITQSESRAYDAAHGIVTEAWAPLAVGDTLTDPVIVAIANRYQRSSAQVILRWHLQLGNVIIPKSVKPERMAENLAIFDFELDAEAMEAIEGLNRNVASGMDPDQYNPGVE